MRGASMLAYLTDLFLPQPKTNIIIMIFPSFVKISMTVGHNAMCDMTFHTVLNNNRVVDYDWKNH